MTDEEKKAIISIANDILKPLACGDITICDIEDLQTVLNLIEKQEEEIDEMAEKINEAYLKENEFWLWFEKYIKYNPSEKDYDYCKKAIKQYFENKVKTEDK